VYSPCILQTKKRYVGFMYENLGQKEPHFEAKGIEIARRDQCPATHKIQEKVLRLLFTTRDVSVVRRYLMQEWTNIYHGRCYVRDFIFRKEVRRLYFRIVRCLDVSLL
jgi:DNA polymerase zeta